MKTYKYRLLACLAFLSLAFAPKLEPTLKDAFKKDFYVGAALNQNHVSGRNPAGQDLVKKQFNSITAENLLKWVWVHPRLSQYNFKPADDFVAFGERHKMFMVGHTLVWHQQTPSWVFDDDKGQPVSRQVLLQRLKDHITTVVGRYIGMK
jgi:endo-1,4-beta-xylanase